MFQPLAKPPEGDYVFMCLPPSFLRSGRCAVTRIYSSSHRRLVQAWVGQIVTFLAY